MEKKLILADTNIIIELLKNNTHIINIINSIGLDRIAISSITVMELLYGALNKNESRKIKKSLGAFEIIQINKEVSQIAIELIDNYALSHKLNLPDAFIAAIALQQRM